MKSYAKVLNGLVTQVIVAEAEFFNTFVDFSPGEWIETSYNTRGGVHYQPDSNTPSDDQTKALRKNYAGIGYSYDKERDAFIPPKPASPVFTLNEITCLWESPEKISIESLRPSTPLEENQYYSWNESTLNWEIKTR
jgi:hypothetical protein